MFRNGISLYFCNVHFSDHHMDQWPVDLTVKKNIELVGSCCTLVAEKILTFVASDNQMSGLVLGTILLDTVGMDPRAGRVTEKDKNVVRRLQGDHYQVDLHELYKSVSDGKFTTKISSCF